MDCAGDGAPRGRQQRPVHVRAGQLRAAIQLRREQRPPGHGNVAVWCCHRGIRPDAGTDTAAEDRDSHHAVEAWGVSVTPSVNPGAWPRGWSTQVGFGRGVADTATPGTRAPPQCGCVKAILHSNHGTNAHGEGCPYSLFARTRTWRHE